jgi:MSHA biogenesis protein MshN
MSLVNDMLRDLESRRRQVPAGGLGSDKLIPAMEIVESRSSWGSLLFWVPVLMVAAIAVLWYLQTAPRNQPISMPVAVSGGVAGNAVTASSANSAVSGAVAPASTPPGPGSAALNALEAVPDTVLAEELARMAQRMQALEQQNMALEELARAVAASDVQTASGQRPVTVVERSTQQWNQAVSAPTQPSPGTGTRLQQNQIQQSQIQPGQPQGSTATGGSNANFGLADVNTAPLASSLVRNPSELSYSEADRQQVQQALAFWQGGQRAGALQMLRNFTASNPEAHQSREMLAKLLLQQGDTIAALEQADRGLQLAPDHGGYKKVKARVLMAAGLPGEAVALLEVRAPSLTGDSEYHELLAASRLAAQRYDEALISYQGLAGRNPEEARWWYGAAVSLDALGRGFEAAEAYERALQLGGLSVNLHQLSQQRLLDIRQN